MIVVVESFRMAEIHDALKQTVQAPFISLHASDELARLIA